LGPVTLKGWTQAIPIWQVLGATDVESRFEARQKSKFALLIGRVPRSRWFLAIPYRAFELRQHAIEYVTPSPLASSCGISRYMLKSASRYSSNESAPFLSSALASASIAAINCGDGIGANTLLRLCHLFAPLYPRHVACKFII
jgi:hypothetical protein